MVKGFVHKNTINESAEWYTPPEIFEALGITFDIDPCSPGEGRSFVPAKKFYTKQEDGLKSPWEGNVFLNPPYGKETPLWMEKLSQHGHGIALVFARTDTKWFQENAKNATAICFISSRVRFFKGNTTNRGGNPGTGSILIAYGEDNAKVLERSGLGLVARLT